jgi:hypothetical protein
MRCLSERPTLADATGTVAARVRDAKRRRDIMAWASRVHQAAGEGDHDALERLFAEPPDVAC